MVIQGRLAQLGQPAQQVPIKRLLEKHDSHDSKGACTGVLAPLLLQLGHERWSMAHSARLHARAPKRSPRATSGGFTLPVGAKRRPRSIDGLGRDRANFPVCGQRMGQCRWRCDAAVSGAFDWRFRASKAVAIA